MKKSISLYIEQYIPFIITAIISLNLYYYQNALLANLTSNDITTTILYSSVFNWSSIQTGFLFGIFGYIGGKSDGFIYEVKNTMTMRRFLDYMRTAIWLGYVVIFISIPMMVIQDDLISNDWKFFIFLGWAFLSLWSFFSFLRVAHIFGLLMIVDTRNSISTSR